MAQLSPSLFFQKFLCVPFSTPAAAFYLELGVMPISVILKVRRLNYLHNILTGPKSGTLYKFFMIQWLNPSRGDWTEQVKLDLDDFKINRDLKWMASISKNSFKRIVKTKATEYALRKLCAKKTSYKKT